MNRPIKFRAWDKVLNRWVNATSVYIEANHGDVVHALPSGAKHVGCDHVEVSQFTGLTDKNGKEIYEGDVVNVFDSGHDETLRLQVEFVDGRYSPFGAGLVQSEDVVVVGNIYENPKLIEKSV